MTDNDTKWKDFAAFIRYKETIGLVTIAFLWPFPRLRDAGQPCVAFDVMVGYYLTLIQPELRRVDPPMVQIDPDPWDENPVDSLPEDSLVRVRTYF